VLDCGGAEEQARQLEYYRALDDGTCYQVGHTSSCTCPICTQNRRRAHKGAKGMKPGGGGGGGGGVGGGMYRPLVVSPPPALNGGTVVVSRTFAAPSVTAAPAPMAAGMAALNGVAPGGILPAVHNPDAPEEVEVICRCVSTLVVIFITYGRARPAGGCSGCRRNWAWLTGRMAIPFRACGRHPHRGSRAPRSQQSPMSARSYA